MPPGRLVPCEEGAGTAGNPFHLVLNCRVSTSSYGGLFRTGPLAGQQFVAPGVIGPFIHGAPSGSTGIESGGDGTYLLASSLLATLRTDQVYSRFDFNLTDNLSFYAQGSYSRAENGNDFASPGVPNLVHVARQRVPAGRGAHGAGNDDDVQLQPLVQGWRACRRQFGHQEHLPERRPHWPHGRDDQLGRVLCPRQYEVACHQHQ